jgi:hypothetical protein
VARLKVVSLFAFGILVWAFLGSGCSSVGSLSLTLSPATVPALNPGQTQTITAAVTNDVNNEGVTWSLSGPGSLSDNLPGSVVYIAPSTVQVTSTATITATSVANTTVTATATITINAVLTITTTSLPPGNVGIPYPTSFINAAGATAPFTWAITSGSLPPGLTLGTNTSSSVSITGTPTTLGTFKFTIQVTDAADASVSQALSITIDPPPPLSVTTASLVDGTVGTTYSQQLQASSGTMPYTWSIIGTLPPGLVLTGDLISGTPAASGTYPFTVQVMDSSSPVQQTASANLSITINQGTTDNSKLRGNYAFLVRGCDNSSSPAK